MNVRRLSPVLIATIVAAVILALAPRDQLYAWFAPQWVRLPLLGGAIALALALAAWTDGLTVFLRKNTRATSQDSSASGPLTIVGLTAVFLTMLIYIVYLLFQLWPTPNLLHAECVGGLVAPECSPQLKLFLIGHWTPLLDHRLMAIVAICGCLGSYIHATTSLSDFVGNRTLLRSWTVWLFMRIPIGGALALGMYFVLRGIGAISLNGLQAVGGQGAPVVPLQVNPFSFAAIGTLTGMFTKQATDKLAEVFDVLLRSAVKRADLLNPTAPTITSLTPDVVSAGASDTVVTIAGQRFKATSTVTAGGQVRQSQPVSDTQLRVTLPAAILAAPATIPIVVADPADGTSAPKDFAVVPKPTINRFEPPQLTANQGGALAIHGSGFRANATVSVDGQPVTPVSVVNSTLLTLTVPASKLLAPGTLRIGVAHADGVASPPMDLTVSP